MVKYLAKCLIFFTLYNSVVLCDTQFSIPYNNFHSNFWRYVYKNIIV
jgi:hypothetical protein